eukprot:2281969-Alexandrium_andersonii.AAC.1
MHPHARSLLLQTPCRVVDGNRLVAEPRGSLEHFPDEVDAAVSRAVRRAGIRHSRGGNPADFRPPRSACPK